jgi:hypothetical protein
MFYPYLIKMLVSARCQAYWFATGKSEVTRPTPLWCVQDSVSNSWRKLRKTSLTTNFCY